MSRLHFGILSTGIVALLLATSACQHDPVGVDQQPTVCYQTDVKPIIQNNCAKSGCHAGGEIDLRSDAGILRHVTPGKPFESSLYNAITSTWINPMPPSPNPPLTQEQRTIIQLWILQGADTNCGS
ncbi:hypothetical protein KQI65_10080 [bacterium]|nr:hypothetical protein [bacterium]